MNKVKMSNSQLDSLSRGSDLRHKSVRGAFFLVSSSAVDFVVRLGSTLVLARILTPEEFGLVAMVTVLTGFADIIKDLGLGLAVAQRKHINHAEVSSLFWVNVFSGGAGTLAFLGAAPFISWFYGDERLVFISMALATTLLFGGLTVQHEALMNRRMEQGSLAYVRLSATVLSSAVGVILAVVGLGYWSLVIREVLRSVFYLVGVWWLCRWVPSLVLRLREIKQLLEFGRDVTFHNIVFAIMAKLDGVLVGKFFGPVALGAYRQGYSLIMSPIEQLNMPLCSVAQPALASLQSDADRYQKYYHRLVGLVAMVTLPLGAFVAMYHEEVTRIVLGEKWISAAPFLGIFAMVAAIRPTLSTSEAILLSLGKPRDLVRLTAANCLVLCTLMIVGSYRGAMGVAEAHIAACLVMAGPIFHYSFKDSPIKFGGFMSAIKMSLMSVAIMTVCLAAFRSKVAISDDFISILTGGTIAMASYIFPRMLFVRGRSELQEIWHDVQRSLLRPRSILTM